jgi:predicted small lipoprotein YifL
VQKTLLSSAIALTLALTLPGCGKKEAQPAAQAPTAAAPAQMPAEHPTPSAIAGTPTEIDLAGIAKAEGGKTVAEVYAEKDALAGTAVAVRGKVVKVNAGIMDKNWLHVRDGSGEEGTNDLTVTTAGDLPELGATVLVSGNLATDKDFGMGYQYPVILEDAEVTVE